MVTFLFTYVVPKFADLFNSLDAKLPEITVFMLNVGVNAQKYAPFVLVGLAITGVALWRWKDTDRGGDRIDRVILSLPLLGDIRLKHQVASFSRMLSTLLQGGLPLVPLPAPPGPGYGEIPLRALRSDPRPVPSLPAPDPSPEKPLPGPVPRPIPPGVQRSLHPSA